MAEEGDQEDFEGDYDYIPDETPPQEEYYESPPEEYQQQPQEQYYQPPPPQQQYYQPPPSPPQEQKPRYETDREEGGVRFVTSRWAPPAGDDPGTDIAVMAAGYVPITPLTLDQTAYTVLAALGQLELEAPGRPTR